MQTDNALEKFGTRLFEWVMAWIVTAYGFAMLPDTVEILPNSAYYSFLRQGFSEFWIGVVMFSCGAAWQIALVVNGMRPQGTPIVRACCTFTCAMIYGQMSQLLWARRISGEGTIFGGLTYTILSIGCILATIIIFRDHRVAVDNARRRRAVNA